MEYPTNTGMAQPNLSGIAPQARPMRQQPAIPALPRAMRQAPVTAPPMLPPQPAPAAAPAAPPTDSYNPAARDQALKALAAAPTAAPGGMGAPITDGGFPVPGGAPPVDGIPPAPVDPATGAPPVRPERPDFQAYMQTRPDAQAMMQQIHAATDPAVREQLIGDLMTSMQDWRGGMNTMRSDYRDARRDYRDENKAYRDANRPDHGDGGVGQDFSSEFDRLGAQDRATVAPTVADSIAGADAAAQADAIRMKKMRLSRAGG